MNESTDRNPIDVTIANADGQVLFSTILDGTVRNVFFTPELALKAVQAMLDVYSEITGIETRISMKLPRDDNDNRRFNA